MEAHTRTPRELFEGNTHYEVPAFQRPYVWNEEDQWEPLWDDVVRVAEACVTDPAAGTRASADHQHFLGAVVYESKRPLAGDVTRHDVIDGQQRMTTLQLLIDAVHEVVQSLDYDAMAESLEELILNGAPRFENKRERFKLWPSQADRTAFEHAMQPNGEWSGEHRVVEAHAYFAREAQRWIEGSADEDGTMPPGTEEARVEALCSTLQDRLVLVAIDLTGREDAQLIFETLNDRGTPLLKADLIKNWVFRNGETLGADVDMWAVSRWADFDTGWWREEIRQGRLIRSRVDIFLQYWLTMRRQEELKVEDVFRAFVVYAGPQMTDRASADALLVELRRDADTYRAFAQLDTNTAEGLFHRRVIERLELAATTPVFLWLLSTNHRVPADQRSQALRALESWAVRRTLLRLTMKGVNTLVVSMLKKLSNAPSTEAGDVVSGFLSEQTAESRHWPTDADLTEHLPKIRLYGNVRQDRLRVVLGACEQHLRGRDSRYEAVQLPAGLEVEHVMPQGWRTYWDPEPRLDLVASAERDRLVNTIGNLTLVTKSLNGFLSNRPWTDAEAQGLREGGEAGKGKRSLLNSFSLLVLNKRILDAHIEEWTEADIAQRSDELAKAVCDVWPGPIGEIQAAAREAIGSTRDEELGESPWTDDDIRRLAADVGETLGLVLDTLATHPEQRWSGEQFRGASLTSYAHAALGALTNKVRGPFRRSNSPVVFENVDGEWTWSLSSEFAAQWRAARRL